MNVNFNLNSASSALNFYLSFLRNQLFKHCKLKLAYNSWMSDLTEYRWYNWYYIYVNDKNFKYKSYEWYKDISIYELKEKNLNCG